MKICFLFWGQIGLFYFCLVAMGTQGALKSGYSNGDYPSLQLHSLIETVTPLETLFAEKDDSTTSECGEVDERKQCIGWVRHPKGAPKDPSPQVLIVLGQPSSQMGAQEALISLYNFAN